MPVGTVKWFNETKGFGFIEPDEGGADAFVHISAVERAGMGTLRENQRVSYELQEDRPGKMSATNLRSAEEPTQPPQTEGDSQQSDHLDDAAD
jgi:CspA family cold shock protein